MSTPNYAPAPWKLTFGTSGQHDYIINDTDGNTVVCWSQYTLQTKKLAKANARLIAAAPDLLKALQGLMYKDCGEPAFVAARAAIAKATGETK